ncbi:hypothetical protein E4U53_000359 [Claviceps sorghi]|nr:hypothetical protein E4U53_000359 [Claviceps sorghi]
MAAALPTITETLTLIWVLWAIALGMVALRIVFQWRMNRQLYAADYFVILGLMTFTTLTAIVTITVPHGYFMANYFVQRVENPSAPPPLPLEEINQRSIVALKYTFSLLPLFWTTVWSAKLSILFFIRRLLIGLPSYMLWWRICLVVVVALYFACLCSQYLTCLPLERNWVPYGCSRPDDFERQDGTIKFATGADISSDLLTMILPLNLLRNLTVTKLQKLWLITVFSLSAIIIAVALVRLIQVVEATDQSRHDLLAGVKMLLARSLWSQIESTVALVVASLPALRFIGKKRVVQDKIPNSYGLVTIGGTGRSRPRPWELEEGSEESISRQYNQTGPEKGGLKGSYEIGDPHLDRTASGHSTRPETEADGESQSVRRCV